MIKQILNNITDHDRVASAYIFLAGDKEQKIASAHYFAAKLNIPVQQIIHVLASGLSIGIDQVKEVQSLVQPGALPGEHLMVMVEDADKMTEAASAAFLKTLEEPPCGVVFVLLVEREDKILPTIYSRCQRILFPEKKTAWQKKEEYNVFYQSFGQLANKSVIDLLGISRALAKEKDNLEELLYELAYFMRYQTRNIPAARKILDCLRYIKRRANQKVALDALLLDLGAIYA